MWKFRILIFSMLFLVTTKIHWRISKSQWHYAHKLACYQYEITCLSLPKVKQQLHFLYIWFIGKVHLLGAGVQNNRRSLSVPKLHLCQKIIQWVYSDYIFNIFSPYSYILDFFDLRIQTKKCWASMWHNHFEQMSNFLLLALWQYRDINHYSSHGQMQSFLLIARLTFWHHVLSGHWWLLINTDSN